MSDDTPSALERADVPVDAAVAERVVEDAGVSIDDLADVLTVLDAELRGLHSEFEREHDYVTVEGRRAYVVDREAWEAVVEGFDLDSALVDTARRAHTEQARLLVDAAVSDVRFDDSDVGIVVGVETAEEMS
ncbi:hypothetical protein C2R22_18970 [Salinigranum rubrum]|uniref:DUF8048 domain-containing protein n=1 Tax=Salinigranum rubrum TaxID=755307 RepID=A0A2I8VNG9_9EURY|nr:hypothetical protein [Salinigranum rubrum]AUV83468.1 hypothetical protein C2R22_18970 [Salinigranum rubrum]